MATKSQRTVALALALLFFATSVATTVYVIWTMNQEEPVATGNEIDPNSVTQDQPNQTEENKLQGKPLANFTPLTTPITDIQKTDDVVGTGAEASANSTITINYTLANADDGIVRESSFDRGQPLTSPLSGLIPGWQQGVPGMKVGGKRRLIIPSNLAYNDGKDLVFDIELLEVK